MSLIRRAFRLLLGALCMKRSVGKVVITIDEPETEQNTVHWVVVLLAVLGVVTLCCGLAVGVKSVMDCPRIQMMSASDDMSDTEGDRWSLVSESEGPEASGFPQTQGLRRRTPKPHRYTDPAPVVPRSYPAPNKHENQEDLGTPQAQVLDEAPEGSRTMANPSPDNPSYPSPQFQTPSGASDRDKLGSEKSERGCGRRIPPTGLVGSSSA